MKPMSKSFMASICLASLVSRLITPASSTSEPARSRVAEGPRPPPRPTG